MTNSEISQMSWRVADRNSIGMHREIRNMLEGLIPRLSDRFEEMVHVDYKLNNGSLGFQEVYHLFTARKFIGILPYRHSVAKVFTHGAKQCDVDDIRALGLIAEALSCFSMIIYPWNPIEVPWNPIEVSHGNNPPPPWLDDDLKGYWR